MPTQILMPQLSPTMEEGKLAKWHVKEGDQVRSGDVLAEIETDKATMEVEAPDDGTIDKLLVAEGTEHVPVNYPIAHLLTEDDSAAAGSPSPLRGEDAAQSAAGEGGHKPANSGTPSPRPSPQWGEGDPAARPCTPCPTGARGLSSPSR